METVTSLTVENIETKEKFSALFQVFPNVSVFGLRHTRSEVYDFVVCELRNHPLDAHRVCTCGKHCGWDYLTDKDHYFLDETPRWPALATVKFVAADPAVRCLAALIHSRKKLGVPLKRMLVGGALGGIFNGRIKWMKDRVFKNTSIELDRWID